MAQFNSCISNYKDDSELCGYTVTRDDGSRYRSFNSDQFNEAQAYYDYLQGLDNQDKLIKLQQENLKLQQENLAAQKKANTDKISEFNHNIPLKAFSPPTQAQKEQWPQKDREWERKKQEEKIRKEEEVRKQQKAIDKQLIENILLQYDLQVDITYFIKQQNIRYERIRNVAIHTHNVEILVILYDYYIFLGESDDENRSDLLSALCSNKIFATKREEIKEKQKLLSKKRMSVIKRNNSACFIATSCYGNYNSPEVLISRKYRDENPFNQLVWETFCAVLLFGFSSIGKTDRKIGKSKKNNSDIFSETYY